MRDYNGGKDMYVSGNWYMAQRSKSLFGGNTMLSRLMQLLLLLVSGGTDGLPKKERNLHLSA